MLQSIKWKPWKKPDSEAILISEKVRAIFSNSNIIIMKLEIKVPTMFASIFYRQVFKNNLLNQKLNQNVHLLTNQPKYCYNYKLFISSPLCISLEPQENKYRFMTEFNGNGNRASQTHTRTYTSSYFSEWYWNIIGKDDHRLVEVRYLEEWYIILPTFIP